MSTIDKELDVINKVKSNKIPIEFSNKRNLENIIKNIFNHELKEEFQNILIFSKDNFINSVKQKVFSILILKYTNKFLDNQNCISIVSKYFGKISNKYETYYNSLSDKYKAFQKVKSKKNINNNFSKYYFSNHRKHCSNTSNYALHFCSQKKGLKTTGKFIKIINDLYEDKIDYLICENCQKTFLPECFTCYCQYCQEVYFSSQLNKDEKNFFLPATLKHYHCDVFVNDFLHCCLCKNILYLNLNVNKIQCINEKCNNNNINKNTEWKCKNCNKYFTSDFKVYNPLEIKLLLEAINYYLFIKIKAKPNKMPCCKNIDMNTTDFFHSKKCNGLIYLGQYNERLFIVCEKCKAINFNEKFIWTCPKCKCRFREIKENDNNNNTLYLNNNDIAMNFKNKDLNDKLNNFEVKKIKLNKNENNSKDNFFEKRKRIFSQEYDYDNNSFSINKKGNIYNDENYDMNIIKNDNFFKNKNRSDLNHNSNSLLCRKINNNNKRSRNNRAILNIKNLSNNIIFSKLYSNKVYSSSIDVEDKRNIKKRVIPNLTSSNFYSEANDKEYKYKDTKIKHFGKVLRNSNNKKSQENVINSVITEKRQKRYFIPHSGYNLNNCNNLKKYNNISFFENKSNNNNINSNRKKKNYTPNLNKFQKRPLKNDNGDNMLKNISQFCINNEKKGKFKIKNKSPFLLRRILNFSLNNTIYDEAKKKDSKEKEKENKVIKINKKDKKPHHKKNLLYYRIKSSDNKLEKNDKHKKDSSNNIINSIPITKRRKIIISSGKNKSQSDIINEKKEEMFNSIHQGESKKRKCILPYKNEKSKSEDKIKEIKEKDENNSFKLNIRHKYKSRVKIIREDISLKPSDIIEASMVDPSVDIPISNELIKNDEKLYKDIQCRLKKILSKGKLPQFILENYTIISQLGEGSFGSIYKVYNNDTKIKYAMKKIIANDIHSLEIFQKEFEIVHENSHPNILDIHGVCMRCLDTTTYVLYVLMDVAEKDWEVEINERSKLKKYYNERELISMLKQIVNALCFLQKEKNVAHRDIKPENILLFKNNVYKIADFGEAKKSNNNKFRTLRGTEFYMSPILYNNLKIKNDIVRHNPYKSDVFSLGYCIVCATALDFDIIDKIRGKNYSQIKEIFNKSFQNMYSNKFIELIFKMIEHDEKKRVDFIQLKEILDKEF